MIGLDTIFFPMRQHALDFEKPIVELERQIDELREKAKVDGRDESSHIRDLELAVEKSKREIFDNLTPWQRVQLARHPSRPYTLDYIGRVFTDFIELHGDRRFADDRAVIGGFATLGSRRVLIIGTQKGRDTKENIARNFGSAHPEGYRKALRLMQLAAKFSLPVIAFVDTPGAYPGVGAEERHIAEAIAVNLREMMILPTPILAVIIGEGGSGGALGIAVADRVLIMENAYYSVITPEGCAAILWKDRSASAKAAEALKITATDLKSLGLVDDIVSEPLGGAHADFDGAAKLLQDSLETNLAALEKIQTEKLLRARYEKFRAMGVVESRPKGETKMRRRASKAK